MSKTTKTVTPAVKKPITQLSYKQLQREKTRVEGQLTKVNARLTKLEAKQAAQSNV